MKESNKYTRCITSLNLTHFYPKEYRNGKFYLQQFVYMLNYYLLYRLLYFYIFVELDQ